MLSDLRAAGMEKAQQLAERGSAELHYLQKMIQSGAFGIEPPQNFAALAADIRKWGEIGMYPRPQRPA
jgi:fatty-acyl-CoA synthase